ncbi:hypothetical protein J2Y58_001583 [Sphingomonas sp. BE138]|uniref:hypothetical protein n=1 Tax=Sphingomonas sp. BE138 TaxID=2817845 RepID=UPI002860CE3F|nr:hypothetical protein [Sphingomonas sp. BE138]MDR6788225.1 hypothetical protein [Sphingomonas sp. BE138]
MRSGWIGAATVAAAVGLATGPAWAQLSSPASISMLHGEGGWTPAVFVCDSTDRDRVLVLSPPDRNRMATLTSLSKPGLVRYQTRVRVGAGDPGAGQIYYPLSTEAGREVGNVHAINPGMIDAGATTPTVTSVTYGRDTTGCRFVAQTRVLGATAKRSVQVVRSERDGFVYRSYDHDTDLPAIDTPGGGRDTRASLTITGGRLVEERGGRRVYQFANGGYVYRVFASVDASKGGGGVQVWQGGRMVLSEPFAAYTAAS